jgi:enamine deaminase RidA (YjgF/YER057c/UK114 family)
MTAADVVSVQAYLTDALVQRFNTVSTACFKDPRPTRTRVVVSRRVGDGHIEITVTARKWAPTAPRTHLRRVGHMTRDGMRNLC